MSSRAEIVQICMNAAEHIEQCYDFEIQEWLEKYDGMKNEMINFSEAAFLIYSVARIYSRKVDYLEKVVLEWNQRAAAEAAAVAADAKKKNKASDKGPNEGGPNDVVDGEANAEGNNKTAKEKPKRGNKKLLKPTDRIEFKPKEFTVADLSQISLNLDQPERTLEDEFDVDDSLRMKNVFPRINVLQSNLRSNNRFFENLGLVDTDCDNPDTLRDFRLFMDTIDEPIRTSDSCNIAEIMSYDPSKDGGKPKVVPKEQAHCSIYLPADYLKEQYNIEIEDNSDYLNMLRYNEEIRRLNLKSMTVEQLVNLKIGTYLNDVLHGTNVSGCVPPLDDHTTTIDESVLTNLLRDTSITLNTTNVESSNDTVVDKLDQSSILLDSFNVSADEPSAIEQDETTVAMNDTTIADESSLLDTTQAETTINSTAAENNSMVDTTANETIDTTAVSDMSAVNDTIDSVPNETSQVMTNGDENGSANATLADEMDNLENMLNPVVQISDIFNGADNVPETVDLNGPMGEALKIKEKPLVELTSNIFQLPEQLLRRPKIFKLTDEFDLWIAARKQKLGNKPEPTGPKLFRMFDGTMIMIGNSDSDTRSCISENEEFYGFDQYGNISSLSFSIIKDPVRRDSSSTWSSDFPGFADQDMLEHGLINPNDPGVIVNRTVSQDSGINENEKAAQLLAADSGIAELSQASDQDQDAVARNEESVAGDGASNDDAFKVPVAPTEVDSGFSEIESCIQSSAADATATNADGTVANDPNDTNVTLTDMPADDTLKPGDNTLPCPETSLLDMNDDEEDPNLSHQSNNHDDATAATSNDANNEQHDEMQEMVERVSNWHKHLRPILERCEERSKFDIHALGSDIIDGFPEDEPEKVVSFADIMKSRDQSYTARYFLSLLLLTNTKNVHIERTEPELNGKKVCHKDDLKVKLLNRTRHLDSIQNMESMEHMDTNTQKRPASEMDDSVAGPSTSTSWQRPPPKKKTKSSKT